MASRRRRGRPRKNGARYRSGNLKPREPVDSARVVAVSQPHRRGLGDQVLDQLAESELGRMVLRGKITRLQALAGERYGRQWRTYLATLDGPRWPWAGSGRVFSCDGCPTSGGDDKCACGLAARAWRRSWDCLTRVGAATLVTELVAYEVACAEQEIITLRRGLDALAFELGLTNQRNRFGNASSQIAAPPPASA